MLSYHERVKVRDLLYKSLIISLLNSGGDLDQSTSINSDSYLHHSVRNNFKWGCIVLLSHGASVNILNENHDTPLHYAIKNRNDEIVKILLEYGAKDDIKNKKSITANNLRCKK